MLLLLFHSHFKHYWATTSAMPCQSWTTQRWIKHSFVPEKSMHSKRPEAHQSLESNPTVAVQMHEQSSMESLFGVTKKDARNSVCWGFTEVYEIQTCAGKKDFSKRKLWREKLWRRGRELCMQIYGGFLKTVAGAREGRDQWQCRNTVAWEEFRTKHVYFLLKKGEVSPLGSS